MPKISRLPLYCTVYINSLVDKILEHFTQIIRNFDCEEKDF